MQIHIQTHTGSSVVAGSCSRAHRCIEGSADEGWVCTIRTHAGAQAEFLAPSHTRDGNQPRGSSLLSSAIEAWAGCQHRSWTTEETGRGGIWAGLMDGGAWLATVHGIEKSRTELKQLSMQHSRRWSANADTWG